MCALERAAGPISTMLACRRILIDKDSFSDQLWKLFIAGIAQKQGLTAIADEDEGLVRDLQSVHGANSGQ